MINSPTPPPSTTLPSIVQPLKTPFPEINSSQRDSLNLQSGNIALNQWFNEYPDIETPVHIYVCRLTKASEQSQAEFTVARIQ